MKKRFPLGAIIGIIIIVTFDVLTFILTKKVNMDKQFWLGLVITNISFIAYILVKFLVKRKVYERGIFPLDLVLLLYALLMLILSIIIFVIPRNATIFTTIIVVEIIILMVVAILIMLSVFTKEHVKNDEKNKIYLNNENEVLTTLRQISDIIKDEHLQGLLKNLIDDLIVSNIDPKSEQFKQIREYVSFIYRDANNENWNNVIFNVENIRKILNK